MCRGVLEIEKRVRQWSRYLQDAAESFQAAPGVWRKYRALLPPMAQWRIVFSRMRGRLVYGSYRRYALLSTLRFITGAPRATGYLIVALIFVYITVSGVAYFINGHSSDTAGTAAQSNVDTWYPKLWKATQLDYTHRLKMLQSEYRAASAHGPYDYHNPPLSAYVIALVGLDNAARGRFIADEVVNCYGSDPPLKKSDCTALIGSLDAGSDRAVRYFLQSVLSAKSADTMEASLAQIPGPPLVLTADSIDAIVARGCTLIGKESTGYEGPRLAYSLLRLKGITQRHRAQMGSALVGLLGKHRDASLMDADVAGLSSDLAADDRAKLSKTVLDAIHQSANADYATGSAWIEFDRRDALHGRFR